MDASRSIGPALVAAALLMACGACEDKGRRDALARADEAEAALFKVKAELAECEKRIAELNQDLEIVKSARNGLQKALALLTEQRDSAVAESEKANQSIAALNQQLKEQGLKNAHLEKELREFEALVAEQQATIAEQQKLIAQLKELVADQEPVRDDKTGETTDSVPPPMEEPPADSPGT